LRLLTRLRATIVKDRGRIACRIKSKLFQFGLDEGLINDATTSEKWIKNLHKIMESFPRELKYTMKYLCDQWLRLTTDLKGINKEIAQQSKSNERLTELEKIYKSVPGIGNVSSKELSRELGTLSQFSSNKHAYSYVGLTPSESSSGEKRRQGGISHCGRPRIRHLLIEVAWRHVGKNVEMASKFSELAYRRGKKRAIVAIARILVGRLRCCLMNGMVYQMQERATANA
jgi:transposase